MGWQRREDCFGNPETLSSQVDLETNFNNRDCWTAAVGCVHDVLNPAVSGRIVPPLLFTALKERAKRSEQASSSLTGVVERYDTNILLLRYQLSLLQALSNPALRTGVG